MDTFEQDLTMTLNRNWWVLLLRGIIAILFGTLTWIQPGISLAALVFLFGFYALADGILGIGTALSSNREHTHWWMLLFWGLVSAAIGILTLLAPGITAIALLFYIAAWAIATGILQILLAIHLRKVIKDELWLILGGFASVVFGALLIAYPGAGALAILWVIATYAVVFGVIMMLLAFRARSLSHHLAHA